MDNIISLIIAFGGGLFSIAASLLNWDFFFDSRKASFMIKILGRNGARIFYGLLGLFLLFMGYKLLMN
jgi:small neutral amino acid transporter SnatA (MarC family)